MNYIISGYIIFCVIKSVYTQDEETCDSTVTDLKYHKIDIDSYCAGKACVVKCCGANEVIYSYKGNKTCKDVEVLKAELKSNFSDLNITESFSHIPFDYSDLAIYQNDIYKGKTVSQMKFQDFAWVQSKIFLKSKRKCAIAVAETLLLEKGTLVKFSPNRYELWAPMKTPDYCVDLAIGFQRSKLSHAYMHMTKFNDEEMLESKNIFIAIAMAISAFFLLLVLIVYSVLHQLRNIQGMLLVAYVATLMCMYTIKAGQLFYRIEEKNSKVESSDCTVVTQIIYYLILASFFWLKLMSFDIWWTFRGTRKLRDIHRRGINFKFMIYASYAYGAPAAITVFAAIMDNQPDLPPHIVKPFFNKCFVSDSFFVYLYVPLMILTALNCLLFLMTVYNIWLIKRNMANFDKKTATKTQKNQNRFWLYIKLSSIMGVSWILEIIQIRLPDDAIPVWLYILMNAYNVFIGVIIFFLFVFKTNIFLMLCKRFNIENRWTRKAYNVNSSTRSELSKSSKNYNSNRGRSTTDSDLEEGSFKKNEGSFKNNEEGIKMSGLKTKFTTPTE